MPCRQDRETDPLPIFRRSPTVAAYDRRLRRDDPERNKIALVATAHDLARVMYALLRKQQDWREAA